MQFANGNFDFAMSHTGGNATPAAGPYADLAHHLAAGGVSVLVGAELSVAAGLPSWYDLLAELCAQIDYTALPPRQWASGSQLIDAAQAYVNRRGLFGLISHLKQRLDTTRVRPSAAHHALARLPVSLVFTANLDDLLERAFREAGRQVEVVARDSSIPFLGRGPGTVNVVKLYGDLGQPDTVVLTKEQSGAYPTQRPHTIGLVQHALATTDMLYLGWGGANPDPYFDQLFGQLLSSLGEMMHPGYAVVFAVTEHQREDFRRRQIRLVELPDDDPAARLAGWLESLAGAAEGAGAAAPAPAGTRVVSTPVQPQPPPVAVQPAPSRPTSPSPLPVPAQVATPSPDVQLSITLAPDGRTLSYMLNSPDGAYNLLPAGSVSLAAPPRELLQRTFDRLSAWARLGAQKRSPAQTAQALREQAAIGQNLYDELFPAEFKRLYPALRERHLGGNLLLTTADPWIPWEMVRPVEHDRDGQALYDDPPLGESFCLARWIAGPTAPSRLPLASAVVVAPRSNLAAVQREHAYFAALAGQIAGFAAGAAPLQSVEETLASFSAGQTQLYHFACHGNFDLSDPNDSRLILAGGHLTPADLGGERKSGLLRSRPLVFVNACHTGERGFGLTRLGGWTERFIAAGASAFIGSLWEINDALAARFAAEFYDRLLGLAGHSPQPLAAAVRGARLAVRDLDPANPTWLAYVLYGNPRALARVPEQASNGGALNDAR
jgi:hypothetical protein